MHAASRSDPERLKVNELAKKELDLETAISASDSESASRQSLPVRLARVLGDHPDHVSVGGAAEILKLAKSSVTRYHAELLDKTVEGIGLYRRSTLEAYARRRGKRLGSSLLFTGIDIERIQRICEFYYRTQLDSAPPELKALAKKVAKL